MFGFQKCSYYRACDKQTVYLTEVSAMCIERILNIVIDTFRNKFNNGKQKITICDL